MRKLSTRGQPPQRDRQSDEMIMEWRKCVFLLVERESRSISVGGAGRHGVENEISRTNTEDEALEVSKFSRIIGRTQTRLMRSPRALSMKRGAANERVSLGAGQCQILAMPCLKSITNYHNLRQSARDLSAVNSSLICLLVFMTAVARLRAHLPLLPYQIWRQGPRLTIGKLSTVA